MSFHKKKQGAPLNRTHPAIAIHNLILNGNPEEYLRNAAESHGLED